MTDRQRILDLVENQNPVHFNERSLEDLHTVCAKAAVFDNMLLQVVENAGTDKERSLPPRGARGESRLGDLNLVSKAIWYLELIILYGVSHETLKECMPWTEDRLKELSTLVDRHDMMDSQLHVLYYWIERSVDTYESSTMDEQVLTDIRRRWNRFIQDRKVGKLERDGDDGMYLTEESLRIFSDWNHNDSYSDLFGLVYDNWSYADMGFYRSEAEIDDLTKKPQITYYLSTAGWSGNEDILYALKDNMMFWATTWKSSSRGGHYTFTLPLEREFKIRDDT